MREEDLFVELKFRPSQLEAIRQLYCKYFSPKIPTDYEYAGTGLVFVWENGFGWKKSEGHDILHNNPGFSVHDCNDDVLWQEFSDLLPHMSRSAVITKMPGRSIMKPHVDRAWRPEAIYFPIEGCTEYCVSEYYDYPKTESKVRQTTKDKLKATHSYSIKDSAWLTNVHEWHGVRNLSELERIAFGWNFKSIKMSYSQCKEILGDLRYI
jgi:hypothetical protein